MILVELLEAAIAGYEKQAAARDDTAPDFVASIVSRAMVTPNVNLTGSNHTATETKTLASKSEPQSTPSNYSVKIGPTSDADQGQSGAKFFASEARQTANTAIMYVVFLAATLLNTI